MDALALPLSAAVREHAMAVTVVDADIDELGHASNIAYVRWIQEIAIAHSSKVGLDVPAYRTLGGVFFVRRHEIDYLRPVLRGDRLALRTWIDSAMAAKCKRATEISNESGTVVCRAMTTWGFVEIATGRPIRIPDAIRLAFGHPRESKPPPPPPPGAVTD
jgi:acyl-CoA thioester hydrolase